MQKFVEGARAQGVVAQKVRRVRGILAASTMLGMPVAAAALGLVAPLAAHAQSDILAGSYIKVGINGTVGSLGYGGGATPGILYDGSGTGTFNPAYDYLTPGSPFEGFVVTADGMTTAINNNAGGTAVTGSLVNYSGVAYGGSTYDQRAVWTGTYGSLFSITNDYFFNNNSQQVGIRTAPRGSVLPQIEVACDRDEAVGIDPGQLRSEVARMLLLVEAGRGADHLEALDRDTEPRAKPPHQQADFRTSSAAIEVGLVEDDGEFLVRVRGEPGGRLIEDGPFDRTHQHIFEHRIVGDQQIRRGILRLVARDQFRILGQGDCP